MKFLVLILFLLAYSGIVIKREKGNYFVYSVIFIFLLLKIINFSDIVNFLNYNVLGIFLGTSILSFLFTVSKVPSVIINRIVEKKLRTGIVYLLICIITSFISAFVENVATILIMAPVALEFTRKYKLNPVPLFVGMAISSNLQGCATMVGDSPSIILAMETGMNFNNFFYMPAAKLNLSTGKPGIFFFVQFGAILSFFILYLFFRKEREITHRNGEKIQVSSWIPAILIITMIFSLAATSFLQEKFSFFPAVICLSYGIGGLIWFLTTQKEEKISPKHIDWDSFFLLIGIFILVGTIKKMGFIEDIANFLVKVGEKNPFVLYLIIVWFSVLISSFVDNIPYTLAMLSGIKILSLKLGVNPFIYYFGLLMGSCIGGNITPIGASCNVVGVGILRKNGYKVNFIDFAKIGLPFTLIAVSGSSLLMWFIYRG
ncbi:TRAP transporter large permease subunit [bacterium]|nr:TRAP transporter large permease subunit [bacterium]